MKRVVILQEFLPQYRVPFFDQLRWSLALEEVELVLVHGQPPQDMALRRDQGELPWAVELQNRQASWRGFRLVWQPALRHIRNADLVVVEHANRLLINYLLLLRRRFGHQGNIAFWGHGANLQANAADTVRERFKAMLVKTPDRWFAYTEGVAKRLSSTGYPDDQITVVQNAVEVPEYERIGTSKRPQECIYVGGLSENKGVEFLLDAAAAIFRRVPGFHLTVVGDGPQRALVQQVADTAPWLTYEGPLFGDQKARLMAQAELTLMPGLVGLAIVDAFAAQAPVITRDLDYHSPEIEYLEPGRNGVVLPKSCTPDEYAFGVSELLRDRDRLDLLRAGCQRSASRYSLSSMVANFSGGVLDSLDDSSRSQGEASR